jgi:hypothetical protein
VSSFGWYRVRSVKPLAVIGAYAFEQALQADYVPTRDPGHEDPLSVAFDITLRAA